MNSIEMRYDKLEAKILAVKGKKCDQYDYFIAAFCGLVAGIVDIVFVGKPNSPLNNTSNVSNSVLGDWSDKQSEKILSWISDRQINKDMQIRDNLLSSGIKKSDLPNELAKRGIPSNLRKDGYPELKDKITYLENKYRVSYDQSTSNELVSDVGITPVNHHLKSLSHSPDIIGLVSAVLDQFSGNTTFIDGGKVIRVMPVKKGVELRGTTLISKLFCAFVNWMGHLLSDFCGSHSSKGRGMGIPIPFFELFLLCDFGSFPTGANDGGMTFADLALKTFENGYDARFGIAMAIPVILCDLSIRFIWALKQRFYHKKTWRECIPTDKHPDLRIMLIVGNGTLCFLDGADAIIKSGGNILELVLHLNIIAWFRLVQLVFHEIMLRLGFDYEDLKIQFEYLNYKMSQYIDSLKSVDYISYKIQIKELNDLSVLLSSGDIAEATDFMSDYIEKHQIKTDFDTQNSFEMKMSEQDTIITF